MGLSGSLQPTCLFPLDGKSSRPGPGLAASPVSPPAPLRATPPKVAASYSSTDIVEKGKGHVLGWVGWLCSAMWLFSSPLPSLSPEELAGRLAHAIAVGDTQGAGEAAAILARQHAALKVWLQEASFTAGPIR